METYSRFNSKIMSKLLVGPIVLGTTLMGGPIVSADTSSPYWNLAQETHNFTVGNLLTSYNSYRTGVGQGITTEWYNASQINADAAMIRYGDSRYFPYLNNTYTFMNSLWDSNSNIGGYFAQENIDGTGAGGDKYVDDNALTGNAYLDAYQATTGTDQQNYLNSAEAIANWLMNCGLWDTTYGGGGFWWTTNTSNASSQIKGTEVNGLACELFLRLYQITQKTYYKQWADSIKQWLDSRLYDTSDGLYSWEYEKTSNSVNPIKFTYDNAIMIEVDLLYKAITGDAKYLTDAEGLANSMVKTLWNTQNSSGAFIINTSDPRFNPCYTGWASEGLIELYQVDGNSKWMNYAKQNIDTLNATLRNTTNDGYYNAWAPSTGSVNDSAMLTVNQAWMQRIQAMLSNSLSNTDKTPPTSSTTLSATPNSVGWNNSDVTVTLQAKDNDGGAGVAELVYSATGAQNISKTEVSGSSANVVINTEGTTTLSFYAVDAAGNAETSRILQINIDKAKPIISIDGLANTSYVDDKTLPVNFTVHDNISGVDNAKTTATLDAKNVASGESIPLYPLPLGTHTLTVTAVDKAGNAATQSVTFQTTTSLSSMLQLLQSLQSSTSKDDQGFVKSLEGKIQSLIHEIEAHSGKGVSSEEANYLIRDASWLVDHN